MTEVEVAFVGALLHQAPDGAAALLKLVSEEDIADPRLRVVLGLARACVDQGVAPDPAAVFAVARSSAAVNGEHQLKVLSKCLADVYTSSVVPASAWFYAGQVLWAAWRRRLIQTGDRLRLVAQTSAEDRLDEAVAEEFAACQTMRDRLAVFAGGAA
ncbi:hypothetical protein F0L68_00240 [Solihabitans fulvus]|uniref:Uncharacterized protein n=1 Tax=Solihabitans fulvus TaxID=1892852 RepID=A0A5B2XWD7_9PSEU|nr:hypothetical protein [Solihabitans fulvus]KAA2267004.1 hypothetical protein F0L68_00240 [Solihabitans fulvus]